jgi:hypothetical protein
MSVGSVDVGGADTRNEEVKVVEVGEDRASGGQKGSVILELGLTKDSSRNVGGLEQMFNTDAVKRLAIREAGKVLNRTTGWSDVGRLQFRKDGQNVDFNVPEPDAVRCVIKCTASP